MQNSFINLDVLKTKIPLSNNAKQFSDYITDLSQRNVLFMDVMRKRGNEMLEMTRDNHATVLNFAFEKLMDGSTFERPINYWLAKMLPPEGSTTDDSKRPYVIQDPRAGQGPGIGGFKRDSEIGDALRNGHPVYFVGFNSQPCENQTYEDVIHGQLKFYEKIAELHPDSPKMCAIGNCAAGYLTMFSAMQRPDIFGPIMIAGSPLSYWNGERGKNPMRYAGGLIGGSWANSLLGDIGGGKFDGTYLIMNFDLLNLPNFLWTKQYDLFTNIDTGSERYLQFEKWWGDFIQFNTPEIKWLVDKLFIGNELTTGNLITEDGIHLDPRNITSPIITFVSDGDNISPPAQSAGWIADLYKDADEIRARGKTIIYCLNHKVGHLAIFTATKVGKRENEVFVENMDTIEVLAPGLYELVIDTPEGEEHAGQLRSHYEPRTIDDIKALGWNSEEDDRAFATVAKASNAISSMYDKFVHPMFKLFANDQYAETMKKLRPLRLSYSLFAESVNPWMKMFATLAPKVQEQRKEIASDNPFLQAQEQYSKFIEQFLQKTNDMRDQMEEKLFFKIWTNPMVQKFWGTDKVEPRSTPSTTQLDREQLMKDHLAEVKTHVKVSDDLSALFRLFGLVNYRQAIREEIRIRALIETAKKLDSNLKSQNIHEIIKNQAMVIRYDSKLALNELKNYLADEKHRATIIKSFQMVCNVFIAHYGKEIEKETKETFLQLAKDLGVDLFAK